MTIIGSWIKSLTYCNYTLELASPWNIPNNKILKKNIILLIVQDFTKTWFLLVAGG